MTAGEQRQHRAHDADVAGADLLHVAQHAGLAEGAGHLRHLPAWLPAARARRRARAAARSRWTGRRRRARGSAPRGACRRSGPSSRAPWRPPPGAACAARPSSTSTCSVSPTRTPSLAARRSVSTRPSPAGAVARRSTSTMRYSSGRCRVAADLAAFAPVAVAPASPARSGSTPPPSRRAGAAVPGVRGRAPASSVHTATSLRIASVNCVSTMNSIASRKKLPMMTMATAAATPPIDSARAQRPPLHLAQDHAQRRARCRVMPSRSSSVRR